jgi:sigma-54 dependent transcriptional regulator, acetoin dehydrogenase operon transcriptional activator AcoR
LSKGKKGLIREANGGTLFLDEIGDMPLTAQTRLLRVLSEREVTPVGSTRAHPLDIHVIAATHCNLRERIGQGLFREDLYFRLNGAIISMPSLRERVDLAWLAEKILSSRPGESRRLSPDAFNRLRAYSWPGNIRELVNALEYARAIAEDNVIEVDDLPEYVTTPSSAKATPAIVQDQGALLAVLRENGWNISAAARHLGVDRTTLHRRMRRQGIALPPRAY